MNKNQAVDEAVKMMGMPMNQLPEAAIEYLRHISIETGFCGEVCISAYAAYNQAVLGMPCEDELYKIPPVELRWFVDKGYTNLNT